MTSNTHLTTLRRILEDLLADGTFNHRPITAGRVRDVLEVTLDPVHTEVQPVGEAAIDALEADLDAWATREIENGNGVPDFWDELIVSRRIADYLDELGWRKG